MDSPQYSADGLSWGSTPRSALTFKTNNNVETTTQFIGKLDKINFTAVDGDILKGDVLGQSVEVTISTELANSIDQLKHLPVQLVIRVRMNGQHVQSWGALDNEENSKLATWFVTKKADTGRNQYDTERQARETAKAIFFAL